MAVLMLILFRVLKEHSSLLNGVKALDYCFFNTTSLAKNPPSISNFAAYHRWLHAPVTAPIVGRHSVKADPVLATTPITQRSLKLQLKKGFIRSVRRYKIV